LKLGVGALDGVRVLDLGHGVAGPFAARLLGDLGADVIKVEKPGAGDCARTLPPMVAGPRGEQESLIFEYLNWNKRGLAIDLRSPGAIETMESVIRDVDIVIDSFRPGVLDDWGLGYAQMHRWNPAVVVTSISNFGKTGALVDWEATDLIFYAMSGMMSISGKRHPYAPLKHGLRQSLYCAGLSAAYTSLAAYLMARDTGEGEHIDLSIREVMCSTLTGPTSFYVFTGAIPGRHPVREDPLSGDPLDTADGYVAMQSNRSAPLVRYADFLDLPELNIPQYELSDGRANDAEALRELFEARLKREDASSFFVKANEAGLMVGVVQGARQLLGNEHLASRDFFHTLPLREGEDEIRKWRYPVELARMSRTPVSLRTSAPAVGQHTDEILAECAGTRPTQPGIGWDRNADGKAARLPMAGLRVVDLSSILAGPYLCALLADMGAEIIKIEGPQRPDTTRYAYGAFADNDPGKRPWDRGSAYHMVNRGKKSLICDLQTEHGRKILTELLKDADVLVENFTPRVLPGWGFTPEVLHAINPRLIVMSNSGFGATGPWRNFRAQGTTLELTMGFGHVTGYEGGRPAKAGQSYPDFIACWTGLTHLLAALIERARSGLGQRIDQSMYQIGVALIPESLLHYQATGTEIARRGAQDLTSYLSDVFETDEPDVWVAISIRTREELVRLAQLIPALLDVAAGGDETVDFRAVIRDWVLTQNADSVVGALQRLHIPAGRVFGIRDLMIDTNLRARGFYKDIDLGEEIGHRPLIGRPFIFSEHVAEGPRIAVRAPWFGEHNRTVLRDVLGMTDEAIDELYESGVIADEPRNRNPSEAKRADLQTLVRKGSLAGVDENYKTTLSELRND
jgi:crotonobetainyl-CoA:carnitine CoA-transferase CaiB-like acyl-CoA transferase